MGDTDALLVAYVDGELEPEAAREAERLIATDPQALRMVEIFRDTAALLRAACAKQFYERDDDFLSAAPCPAERRGRRFGLALAASLTAAVIGFGGGAMWVGGTPSAHDDLLNETAGYHQIYSRETRHLVEVPADQVEHLTAWLGQRLDRKLEVPDLTGAGLHFAGGRMIIIDGRPVGQLMYTRNQGLPIGICLTRADGHPSSISVEQRGTLRLASWEDGSYAYVVIGELDDRTAHDIAERVEAQLKS
jgi:anti-sigma factor RsiW